MHLAIYLDDDMDSDLLAYCLRRVGHTVISPRIVGTHGWDDPDHLNYAAWYGCAFLASGISIANQLHRLNRWL